MKNQSDLVYTHKVELKKNDNLYTLNLDVDFKTSFINGINFNGPYSSSDLELINDLKNKIKNINVNELINLSSDFLDFSLPIFLLLKFYKEFFGVIEVPANNEIVCLCSGVTRKSINDFCISRNNTDFFGEMMSELAVTTSCGDCLKSVQNLYIDSLLARKPESLVQTFPEFRGESYAQLIIKIDDLLKEYNVHLGLKENYAVIKNIKNFEIEIYSLDQNYLKTHREKLTKLFFSRLGIFIFLQ